MQIHELDPYVGSLDSNTCLAVDDGVETTKLPVTSLISTVVGAVQMFAGTTAPTGWLLCRGQAISRLDYAELFAVIGTQYGEGDGSTTFNLPDLQDRFPVGVGANYSLNDKGGADSVTLSANEMPAHTHGNKSLTGWFTTRKFGDGYVQVLGRSGIVSSVSDTGSGTTSAMASGGRYGLDQVNFDASHEHDSAGGGSAHENRPPYIALNYIICTGK